MTHTTQPHLTAHAQTRFHHFAHTLVTQDARKFARQTVSQNVENLEQNDLVRDRIARLKLAVRTRCR